jgi:NADH-quinone oxidoreductase subunit M
MAQMGGLARVMPVWSFFMVFFCLASVGLPGLNGFVGEFLTLMGAFNATHVLGVKFAAAAAFGMLLGAIYILYMVGRVVFGPVKVPHAHGHGEGDGHGHEHPVVPDLNLREIAVLTPLAIGCLWLGLYPKPVLETLEAPAIKIVQGHLPQREFRPFNLEIDPSADAADAQEVIAPAVVPAATGLVP